MKNHEKKDWDKDKIILALVKMRVEKFATTKTMLDFLQNDLGFGQTYSYELVKLSKQKVQEIFKEESEESFHAAAARLEEIIETTKNEKHRLDAIKEYNKLLGLHRPQKVDVTSAGKELNVNEIVVKIVKRDGEDLPE